MILSICSVAVPFGVLSLLATVGHAITVKNGAETVFYDSFEGAAAVGTDAATSGRVPRLAVPGPKIRLMTRAITIPHA